MESNDMKEMAAAVSQMLKGYKGWQLKARQLEFEVENYVPAATGDDVIDTMTFGGAENVGAKGAHGGQLADKVAGIAISYPGRTAALNLKHRQELEAELRAVNMDMMRLEHYAGLLDEKLSRVLRLIYLEGAAAARVSEIIGISPDTVKKYRKEGIERLAEMYGRIVG